MYTRSLYVYKWISKLKTRHNVIETHEIKPLFKLIASNLAETFFTEKNTGLI